MNSDAREVSAANTRHWLALVAWVGLCVGVGVVIGLLFNLV